MLDSTVAKHDEKNSLAKDADPTGCPRRQKLDSSLTGSGGCDDVVECGAVEKREMVSMI